MDSVTTTVYTSSGTSMPIVDGHMVDHNFNKLSSWASQIPSVEARLRVVEDRVTNITFDVMIGLKLVEHLERQNPEVFKTLRDYVVSEAAKHKVVGS